MHARTIAAPKATSLALLQRASRHRSSVSITFPTRVVLLVAFDALLSTVGDHGQVTDGLALQPRQVEQ